MNKLLKIIFDIQKHYEDEPTDIIFSDIKSRDLSYKIDGIKQWPLKLLKIVDGLRPTAHPNGHDSFQTLQEKYEKLNFQLEHLLQHNITIAFAGGAGAGKSEVINNFVAPVEFLALHNVEISRVGLVPCPSKAQYHHVSTLPIAFKHSSPSSPKKFIIELTFWEHSDFEKRILSKRVPLKWPEGGFEKYKQILATNNFDKLVEFMRTFQENKRKYLSDEAIFGVKYATVFGPWGFPENLTLYDLPGFSSDQDDNNLEIFRQANVVVWVGGRGIQVSDIQTLITYGGFSNPQKQPVLGVMYRSSKTNPQDIEDEMRDALVSFKSTLMLCINRNVKIFKPDNKGTINSLVERVEFFSFMARRACILPITLVPDKDKRKEFLEKLREKAMAMDAEDVTVGTASILSICSKSAGVSLDVTNLRDKYSKLRRILQTKIEAKMPAMLRELAEQLVYESDGVDPDASASHAFASAYAHASHASASPAFASPAPAHASTELDALSYVAAEALYQHMINLVDPVFKDTFDRLAETQKKANHYYAGIISVIMCRAWHRGIAESKAAICESIKRDCQIVEVYKSWCKHRVTMLQQSDIVDLTDEMLENGYYAALTKTASDLLKNFFKSLDKAWYKCEEIVKQDGDYKQTSEIQELIKTTFKEINDEIVSWYQESDDVRASKSLPFLSSKEHLPIPEELRYANFLEHYPKIPHSTEDNKLLKINDFIKVDCQNMVSQNIIPTIIVNCSSEKPLTNNNTWDSKIKILFQMSNETKNMIIPLQLQDMQIMPTFIISRVSNKEELEELNLSLSLDDHEIKNWINFVVVESSQLKIYQDFIATTRPKNENPKIVLMAVDISFVTSCDAVIEVIRCFGNYFNFSHIWFAPHNLRSIKEWNGMALSSHQCSFSRAALGIQNLVHAISTKLKREITDPLLMSDNTVLDWTLDERNPKIEGGGRALQRQVNVIHKKGNSNTATWEEICELISFFHPDVIPDIIATAQKYLTLDIFALVPIVYQRAKAVENHPNLLELKPVPNDPKFGNKKFGGLLLYNLEAMAIKHLSFLGSKNSFFNKPSTPTAKNQELFLKNLAVAHANLTVLNGDRVLHKKDGIKFCEVYFWAYSVHRSRTPEDEIKQEKERGEKRAREEVDVKVVKKDRK